MKVLGRRLRAQLPVVGAAVPELGRYPIVKIEFPTAPPPT